MPPSDLYRTSGSSSQPQPQTPSTPSQFTSTSDFDPPPVPPPDYTKQTTDEWSKKYIPPLKGAILDKEFYPTPSEAAKTIAHLEGTKRLDAQQQPPPKPDANSTDIPRNLYRSSGTSDILGRAAESPDGKINNLMPGGTRHTAGGEKMEVPSWGDAVSKISLSSFGEALQVPCIRQSLMVGLAVGSVVGGALWVTGRRPYKAVNLGVWSFLGSNVVTFQVCDYGRRKEKRDVRVVREVWEEKRQSKKVEWEKYREERLREAEREIREQKAKERTVRKTGISRDWWSRWIWDSSSPKSTGREG